MCRKKFSQMRFDFVFQKNKTTISGGFECGKTLAARFRHASFNLNKIKIARFRDGRTHRSLHIVQSSTILITLPPRPQVYIRF